MRERYKNLVKFGVVTKKGSDTDQFPVQQVSYDGQPSDCFVLFPYGVHGNLSVDALMAVFSVEGDSANKIGIGGYTADRPIMADGESCIFHPPTGSLIHFKSGGILDINTTPRNGGDPVAINITCSKTTVTGNVDVTGKTNLGSGGPGIGRLGDEVTVTVPIGTFLVSATGGVSNASPVDITGTITAASINNTAN